MKVALVKPKDTIHAYRGGSFYVDNLLPALAAIAGLEISNQSPDLTHYLYFDPFFLTLPPVHLNKAIVTVFDLTPLVLPNLFPPGLKGFAKWQIQKNLLRHVAGIITISEASKKDIVRLVGVPESKVFVTYLAAGPKCRPLKLPRQDFVIYIGDVNPNKNLSALLSALAEIPKQKLVLVGKAFTNPHLFEARALRDQIVTLGLKSRVTLTGFVSEEDKIRLLNQAKAYVQPSIYEGFGLPVLEALACGTPVICGRNSSLPEVAGEAATYVDVSDPKALAAAIRSVKPTGKELAQAAKFSWAKTARATYEAYQKILAQ